MNLLRRPSPHVGSTLSSRLKDAVSLAALTTVVFASSVIAAAEALQDTSDDLTVVVNQAVRSGAASECPQ